MEEEDYAGLELAEKAAGCTQPRKRARRQAGGARVKCWQCQTWTQSSIAWSWSSLVGARGVVLIINLSNDFLFFFHQWPQSTPWSVCHLCACCAHESENKCWLERTRLQKSFSLCLDRSSTLTSFSGSGLDLHSGTFLGIVQLETTRKRMLV